MNYYDDIARGYNRLYELEQREKLRAIAALIPGRIDIAQATTVLDVGCGSGVSSDFWVTKYKAVVTGIDPSKGLIDVNENKLSSFVQGYAEQLPFKDGEFDLIVSLTAIQNFTDVRKGLEEMRRVGKGKFILTVLKKAPNLDDISRHIHTVFRVNFETTIAGKDVLFLVY